MESTGVYWRPVFHVLEGSVEVLLVNAQHVKAVPGRKTDIHDSQWLARLLEHGLLRGSFVPPAPIRELRELTRYRRQVVQEHAREANRIQKGARDRRHQARRRGHVYATSLREVLDRFGIGSAQRKALALRLDRVYRVAHASGHLARFVVFGSFVTSKTEPQDVDVFLVMADTFDASRLMGDPRLLFDHGAAQAHFGASVFWVRHRATWPDEEAAVEFWQVKRDGGRRGIVKVVSEAS